MVVTENARLLGCLRQPSVGTSSLMLPLPEMVCFFSKLITPGPCSLTLSESSGRARESNAAAKLAACDEFIARLPDGYQTLIGENGKTLSGGERQRLSIARAFLKNAPVILLDESTASIDPENETRIQQAISRLIENKTVLIIAHKLRTVAGCDKIVVLDQGNVTEEGTHDALMKENGLYHRLYTLQNESLIWKVRT